MTKRIKFKVFSKSKRDFKDVLGYIVNIDNTNVGLHYGQTSHHCWSSTDLETGTAISIELSKQICLEDTRKKLMVSNYKDLVSMAKLYILERQPETKFPINELT